VLGGGRRLFADDGAKHPLRLVRSEPFETGVVVLEYEPDRS